MSIARTTLRCAITCRWVGTGCGRSDSDVRSPRCTSFGRRTLALPTCRDTRLHRTTWTSPRAVLNQCACITSMRATPTASRWCCCTVVRPTLGRACPRRTRRLLAHPARRGVPDPHHGVLRRQRQGAHVHQRLLDQHRHDFLHRRVRGQIRCGAQGQQRRVPAWQGHLHHRPACQPAGQHSVVGHRLRRRIRLGHRRARPVPIRQWTP